MKHGQIASNQHLNALIYRCFEYVGEENEQNFARKFREQPATSDQIMHTARELILGAYLCLNGFAARYEYMIDRQTPDWSILDDMATVIGLIELANFHIDQTTEKEIDKQRQTKGLASYWRDGNRDNVGRLYACIQNKAQTYCALAGNLKVPYVVALFADFRAGIDLEEVRLCLFEEKTGLFSIYPEVGGVLFFEESFGRYLFHYLDNPNALRVFDIPNGAFPPEAA